MVQIDHYGIEAVIDGGEWQCKDRDVLGMLRAVTKLFDVGGEDPNPDLTIAQEIIRRLGGRIVKQSKAVYNPDVVY